MSDESANSLLREVGRLHLKLQRACVASCSDNSATQCFILGEVFRAGPISLADLVRRLALDKGWVSRAVETLVQQDLLIRNRMTTIAALLSFRYQLQVESVTRS